MFSIASGDSFAGLSPQIPPPPKTAKPSPYTRDFNLDLQDHFDRIAVVLDRDSEFPVILVGTKCDLDQNREVLRETGLDPIPSLHVTFHHSPALISN